MAHRFSSRQGIIAGFTAVILLLGGVILHSWLQLESLTERSQTIGHQVLDLFTTLQNLDERSIDLERNVQQYRLVKQDAFRVSFNATQNQALALIERLEEQKSIHGLAPLLTDWRTTAQEIANSLDKETESTFISTSLAHLSDLQARMWRIAQQWVDDQDSLTTSGLVNQRTFLQLQLLFSFLGAVLIALFISWWLTSPIHQLEIFVARLGRGKFGAPIALNGPADVQRLSNRLNWLLQRLRETDSFQEGILRHTEEKLNAPLVSLKNNVNLLAEGVPGALTDAQREVIGILLANLDALQKQTDNLKQIIERLFQKSAIEKQQVKLRELLTCVVERQNGHPRLTEVKTSVDLACPPETVVWLDVEKVVHVMDSIFRNALDFAPSGSEIRLFASLAGEKLLLECQDQGPGILPSDAPHVFEPFYRCQSRPDYCPPVETGVSLAVAKELTQIMEGDIQLLATTSGTHFRVSLPHKPDTTITP